MDGYGYGPGGEFSDEFLDRVMDDGAAELREQQQMAALSADVNRQAGAEAARQREDAAETGRRPSAEVRLQRGLQRAGAGTYLPPPLFAPRAGARTADGRFGHACSAPDDFGRCAGTSHAAGCHVVTEGAAAAGSAEEARAWRQALLSSAGQRLRAAGLADVPAAGSGPGVHELAGALGLAGNNPSADRRTRLAAEAMARQAAGRRPA